MAGTRKNYRTTRNKKSNEFLGGFKIEGEKDYNKKVIKKYFIKETLLNDWEKTFYEKIKSQEFSITDNQLKVILSIYNKKKQPPKSQKKFP